MEEKWIESKKLALRKKQYCKKSARSGQGVRNQQGGRSGWGVRSQKRGSSKTEEGIGSKQLAGRIKDQSEKVELRIGYIPQLLQDQIDDLFADGVVAPGVVVGCVLLPRDQLLWVEESPARRHFHHVTAASGKLNPQTGQTRKGDLSSSEDVTKCLKIFLYKNSLFSTRRNFSDIYLHNSRQNSPGAYGLQNSAYLVTFWEDDRSAIRFVFKKRSIKIAAGPCCPFHLVCIVSMLIKICELVFETSMLVFTNMSSTC